MKTEILRLISVVKQGVGGSQAGAINLIYTYLLQKYKIDAYNYISINQIGDDLEEFVRKEGKKVYINIRYPTDGNYKLKTVIERNIIRLDIIDQSLQRLAATDPRILKEKLDEIKKEILQREFIIDVPYKEWKYKKGERLNAKIIIRPYEENFDIFLLIEEDKKEKCSLLIYKGKPTDYYFEALFFFGKWKNAEELIITGKNNEVEIHIDINKCKVQYVNLTAYEKAPFFEMMRADMSKRENAQAHENWFHSLSPAYAAIIREANN